MDKKYGGIGLLDALLITFIVLKLTKTIGWSWWFVLAPIWVSLGLVVLALIVSLFGRK